MPPWLLNALNAFGQSVQRTTQGLTQFGQILARLGTQAGAATGRGLANAPLGAARGAAAAGAYVGRELATNNFLQRRVSWAAYHTATAGLESGLAGVTVGLRTGSTTEASRGVSVSVLQQINDKLGINMGAIGQTTAAAASTSELTERIARAGGYIPPELRKNLFQRNFAAEERVFAERQEVQKLLRQQYSSEGSVLNEDNLGQPLLKILDVVSEISNTMKSLKGS